MHFNKLLKASNANYVILVWWPSVLHSHRPAAEYAFTVASVADGLDLI